MSRQENNHVREFTCVECGRDIIDLSGGWVKEKLCNLCIFTPAWFTIPELRALLDPTHSGKEPFDADNAV